MSAKAGVAREVRSRPMRAWAWQDDAACRGESLVLFFGPGAERGHEKDARERKAKAICAQCPALDACRDYSLSRPEAFGLWAGLTEDERSAVRRRRMRGEAAQALVVKRAEEAEQAKRAAEEAALSPTRRQKLGVPANPFLDLEVLRASDLLIAAGKTVRSAAAEMGMARTTLIGARNRAQKHLAGAS